jgi:hypothetical protein
MKGEDRISIDWILRLEAAGLKFLPCHEKPSFPFPESEDFSFFWLNSLLSTGVM